MFTAEQLKKLDREGQLEKLFHPEIYQMYVQWIVDGGDGIFCPNRGIRTAAESLDAVADFLKKELESSNKTNVENNTQGRFLDRFNLFKR